MQHQVVVAIISRSNSIEKPLNCIFLWSPSMKCDPDATFTTHSTRELEKKGTQL